MLRTVLTLGPASSDEKIILFLLEVADRFRLNTSHMNEKILANWLIKLEGIFSKTGKTIPVVIDLQGAKMRIGQYPSVELLPERVSLIFEKTSKNAKEIPVPHQHFFNELQSGDLITLNDAKILLKILKPLKHRAEAKVIVNGAFLSYKGINRQVHPIFFEGLSEKDIRLITICQKYTFVEYAFSFVYDGNEEKKIRPHLGDNRLIAKIERPEALENLTFIDSEFDELWFCRGDLGAQAGISKLGSLQEAFASKISRFKNPCFLAGQVLEHMTYFIEPTRTEVVHLYDIEKEGFEGIVLSDETAIGKNPLAVATFLKNHQLRM